MKIKEGGGMDIHKEREAFEAWLKSLNENGRTTYFLGQESTVAWEAWQAAKAQAVPEGYVLVPMCVSEETKQRMLRVFNESDRLLNCENIYKAMIEAQEPAND